MSVQPFLSWLDHSETDRRKALDIVHLFRERETVDELGVGTIRDAFANLFFPGTSTIQTRAKYFLFIPWIYLNLERREVSSAKAAGRARRAEIELIFALLDNTDIDGVVGSEAKQNLKRLPSEIYWNGLYDWGIRLFPGSRDDYHRYLDRFYRSARVSTKTDDGEPVEGPVQGNWHPSLPSPPPDFPSKATLGLRKLEAEYLRERILYRRHRTLLAFLVSKGRPTRDIQFPWAHPQFGEYPPYVTEPLEHARRFSEAMHGAALLYNLMLAKTGKVEDLIDRYTTSLREWGDLLDRSQSELQAWNRTRFWEIVASAGGRVTFPTQRFTDNWLDMALRPSFARSVATNSDARRIIYDRERALKGARARLDNETMLHRWGGDSGSARLTYRWPITERIVNDILQGLEKDA